MSTSLDSDPIRSSLSANLSSLEVEESVEEHKLFPRRLAVEFSLPDGNEAVLETAEGISKFFLSMARWGLRVSLCKEQGLAMNDPLSLKEREDLEFLLESMPSRPRAHRKIKEQDKKIALIQSTLNLIHKITQDPTLFLFRNAMVADLLTKELAGCGPGKDLEILIPRVSASGEPVRVLYRLTQVHYLNPSLVPYYALEPEEFEGESYPPILLFSPTNLHRATQGNLHSIHYALDPDGPGRTAFDENSLEIRQALTELAYSRMSAADRIYGTGAAPNKIQKVQVMGYSQGAAMTARTVCLFDDLICKHPLYPSIQMNPVGIEKDFAEIWDDLESKDHLMGFITRMDAVSKAGPRLIGSMYEILPQKPDPKNAHFYCELLQTFQKITPVNTEKENRSKVRRFVRLMQHSPFYRLTHFVADHILEHLGEVRDPEEIAPWFSVRAHFPQDRN